VLELGLIHDSRLSQGRLEGADGSGVTGWTGVRVDAYPYCDYILGSSKDGCCFGSAELVVPIREGQPTTWRKPQDTESIDILYLHTVGLNLLADYENQL
jgi:hypothetical protein